jgi:hypothetical protein
LSVSFVSAQLEDVPQPPQVALLDPASEQPLDLRPEKIELRAMGVYLRLQQQTLLARRQSMSGAARFHH